VNNDDGQRVLPIGLPMALAQNANAGLDFDVAFFRKRQINPPGKKETGERLHVAAAKNAARNKL